MLEMKWNEFQLNKLQPNNSNIKYKSKKFYDDVNTNCAIPKACNKIIVFMYNSTAQIAHFFVINTGT